MRQESVNKLTVLLLVTGVSVIFTVMVRGYLMTLLLAGVFSSLSQPIFRRFLKWTRDRRALSSALTLAMILLIVIIPLAIILSIVVAQAVQVGQAVGPWIQQTVSQPARILLDGLENLPFGRVPAGLSGRYRHRHRKPGQRPELPAGEQRVPGDVLDGAGGVPVFYLPVHHVLFIKDGEKLMDTILYYLPLEDEPERKLLDHFTSVSRATLKGTLLIGIIQGSLAALGFWVAGISSVAFWGLLMTVLSIIPLIGASLVWIPAVVILAIGGRIGAAISLGLYCGILVGTVDNILRPILVGKDTKMHELFILLSTLGGISLFGIWGVIIGPIIAALFISIWDLYGKTFAEYLPAVVTGHRPLGRGSRRC
jgi:predicted PurR-regulated permease PerM